MNTSADWDRVERREFTPVDLKHIGWGPKFTMISLAVMLALNLISMGVGYQKLVSGIEANRISIVAVDHRVDALPPVSLLTSVSALTENVASLAVSVATLTTAVQFVAEDVRDLEAEVRDIRKN